MFQVADDFRVRMLEPLRPGRADHHFALRSSSAGLDAPSAADIGARVPAHRETERASALYGPVRRRSLELQRMERLRCLVRRRCAVEERQMRGLERTTGARRELRRAGEAPQEDMRSRGLPEVGSGRMEFGKVHAPRRAGSVVKRVRRIGISSSVFGLEDSRLESSEKREVSKENARPSRFNRSNPPRARARARYTSSHHSRVS